MAVLTSPVLASAAHADAPAPVQRVTVASTARVAALVAQMTLQEKLSLVSPARDPEARGQAAYFPGVPRLGVPELRLTDGPAGVRVTEHTTALPAPIALASSFDDRLVRKYGQVMGEEARAVGQDVLLGPMANIIRAAQAGRNFETFSEDPYLTGRTVA